MIEPSVTVPVASIVELFRSMEYSIRDLETTQESAGRRASRGNQVRLAIVLGRLDAMKEVMHMLAPEACEMASWSREVPETPPAGDSATVH